MGFLNRYLLFKSTLIKDYATLMLKIARVFMVLLSFLVLVSVVYRYGFDIGIDADYRIMSILKTVQTLFFFIITIRIFLNSILNIKEFRLPTKVLMSLFYATLIPIIFNKPYEGISLFIWEVMGNNIFLMVLLSTISFLEIADAIVRMLGRKANPSLIIVVSFFVLIVIGTGFLLLPNSTYGGISVVDALFISTSAVCVTGLTPVDVSTLFTPMGQFFILILIQIGGLGFMTLTSFFAFFFMGNVSIFNKMAVRDLVSSGSVNSIFATLLRIMGLTFVIEGIGALLIWTSINGDLGGSFWDDVFFSCFHSISAFCNAGFSTLPGNLSNSLLGGHNFFFLVISFLVIFGGIGFPIFANLIRVAAYYLTKMVKMMRGDIRSYQRRYHIFNLNTKIVLSVTAILLVGGSVLIGFFEWNNAFQGMSVPDKLVQSFFNSAIPRTAGFNSLPVESFTMQTVLITMLLMWIGGGSQSTAGGIKVNAFAAAMINLAAIVKGKKRIEVFGRTLPVNSVRRSNATILMSILVLFVSIFILTIFEPTIPLTSLVYEAISALGTVGLSLDTTPLLGFNAKIIIIILMFIGRIGLITIMLGIIKRSKPKGYELPDDDIIIN
ncbi:MAG: potassium transporter TrkG [Rikenellaceae bacterium]